MVLLMVNNLAHVKELRTDYLKDSMLVLLMEPMSVEKLVIWMGTPMVNMTVHEMVHLMEILRE